MHIDEFDENDVFFNIHGYPEWDNGLTREPIQEIAENFPGKVIGLAEEGHEEELYGSTHMDEIVETRPESGVFYQTDLGITDAERVILSGGELGYCHLESYKIIRREAGEAEYIVPPEASYGFAEDVQPGLYLFSYEEFRQGWLPGRNARETARDIVSSRDGLEEYDWEECSIQPIQLC